MQTAPEPYDIESSLLYFAEEVLGFTLYPWQVDAIEPFDHASTELTQVSLVTPNGSGKSAVVIPSLVLGWLAIYPKGRVVCTTADGKQLDSQVMPAIQAHRAKFPSWKFIEREIQTPTGGRFVAFTTDDAGRAEGWHKLDDITGPMLIICDEAKTIPEAIFAAIDRCTYNGIIYTSSPGTMNGRFYETQTRPELGFIRVKAGLLDCPHIGKDKIDRITKMHGENSPFTRSALHGEFMVAEGESRYDIAGLERLMQMATEQHHKQERGNLEQQPRGPLTWMRDNQGWVWRSEPPIHGASYIGFCDPATGEQADGSKTRDSHAAGILRAPYIDDRGTMHDAEVVAVLHVDGGCKWHNDVLAERFARLVKHYGDCLAIVEANNSGTEVMRLLLQAGVSLWRREKRDALRPGKKLDVVGFQTTGYTKSLWVGALGRAIREQELICLYKPAVDQFATFILDERGNGQAQSGCHDDWITGVGLGLFARDAATRYNAHVAPVLAGDQGHYGGWHGHVAVEQYQPSGHGACN